MSTTDKNFYNPTMKNIYSILDSLENKLGKYSNYSSYGVENNPNLNNYDNYMKREQDFNMNNNGNVDYNYIKKLIDNEFSRLILPYQKNLNINVNSLEEKIYSINSKIDFIKDTNNNNNSNNINHEYENKENYVTRKEYIALQNQITLMDSSIYSLKKLIEKNYNSNNNIDNNIFSSKNTEIKDNEKDLMLEINNIKKSISQNVNIFNNNKQNEQLKEYDLKIDNIIQNYNIIKEENKNLKGELSQIKEQIINETQKNLNETNINELNSNEIKRLNNKIKDLENNLKNIEEDCSLKLMNFKNNINNFELKFNEIKIKSSENEQISINNNNIIPPNFDKNSKLIEEIIQKKLNELNLDTNKLKELNQNNDSKNEQIFKLFEEQNIAISNLNLKLEKIKNNIELDNKKKFNHLTEKIEKSIVQLNESNIAFNNESRVDTNIIGTDNLNNIKIQINKQNIKLENIQNEIKSQLNKIYEQISLYDKRIDLIENKAKEEKKVETEIKENNIDKDKINKTEENNHVINNRNNISKEYKSKKSSKNSKKSSGNGDNLSIPSLLLE